MSDQARIADLAVKVAKAMIPPSDDESARGWLVAGLAYRLTCDAAAVSEIVKGTTEAGDLESA